MPKVPELNGSMSTKTAATHIITRVSWGITAVVVLQLPLNAEITKRTDNILRKVKDILYGSLETASLTSDDDTFLQQNTNMMVYSNISFLNGMNSIRKICQVINNRNEEFGMFRPLTYTLQPIQLFYPKFTGPDRVLVQLDSTYNNKLEQHLLQYLSTLKDLKYSLDYTVSQLLGEHLKEQLWELQQQWINLKNTQKSDVKRLKTLVCDIRRGQCDSSMIDKALNENQFTFSEKFDKLIHDKNNLEAKGKLINDLKQQQFLYYNVVEHDIDRRDNETTIEGKLVSNPEYDRVICSTDALNKDKAEQLREFRDDLVEKHKHHSKLHLIYADFSYSTFELTKMLVLPSSIHTQKENNPKQQETPSSTEIPLPMPNIEIINILLLGETGVGKSTFINALANYLTFDTLEQAQSSKLVVLIPGSFLTTVGHNFEERTVRFGDADSSNNEDFDHPGQSVTQHCKSYVFQPNVKIGQKLRIIDTPGFGDTRGLDQDDRNMQHILEYINNLSHLNAICFLLKPNASRLNIFFRSCFIQLFSLLGSNARNNIIFCFTNARSTFYTPGDTAPLLRTMLTSLSVGDVPFKKDNTFCFDNQSFFYLAALQNGIEFSSKEKVDYGKSWSSSVTQSTRFVDHIHQRLAAYHLNGSFQSVKHAQLEIMHMIRPMLEAMRNILRNLIICTMHPAKGSFELYPKAIPPPATICSSCTSNPLLVGKFWISHNIPHKIQTNCCTCQCPLDHHIPIDYILEYKFRNQSSEYNQNRMSTLLHDLCKASVDLAHFLMHNDSSSKQDPFFLGLIQMITEEKYLCDNQKPNDFNLKLVDDLRELQKEYDHRMNSVSVSQEQKKVSKIYKIINNVHNYPMVREQMIAVKEKQKMMMKQCEYEVSKI